MALTPAAESVPTAVRMMARGMCQHDGRPCTGCSGKAAAFIDRQRAARELAPA